MYIFLSQSGLSVDTVEALKKVKEKEVRTLCVTNNLNSTMYNLCDYRFYIDAGLEHAIAATKTFSATVVMLWLISLKLAQNKHIDISDETKEIYSIKNDILQSLKNYDNLDLSAKFLSKLDGFAIFGYGKYYPLALETALKIRETSYINTSVFPSGDFVHGHFALLNKAKAFLTFITSDTTKYELDILKKVLKTYKAKSIVVSDVYEDYDCDILVKFNKGQSRIATIINIGRSFTINHKTLLKVLRKYVNINIKLYSPSRLYSFENSVKINGIIINTIAANIVNRVNIVIAAAFGPITMANKILQINARINTRIMYKIHTICTGRA